MVAARKFDYPELKCRILDFTMLIFLSMNNIYFQITSQFEVDPGLVLATVTRTLGSTPQKPGSSALFGRKGLISGTVGGGIVEGKVQKKALELLISKESGHFHYNLANDIANTEDAICGGQISILVDANPERSLPVFAQLKESLENKIPGVLITMVPNATEKEVLINRYWLTKTYKPSIPEEFLEKVEPIALSLLSSGDHHDFKELELIIPGKESSLLFFLEPIFPKKQLVIVGAGHIGKALSHLAHRLDFEVTVVDDRFEFANYENIPDADHVICSDIGEAMQKLVKNGEIYVVIVSRGHKDDAAALKHCVVADLKYIGMIGSKKKISAMKNHFIENALATPSQWDKIYAPVGIDIQSQTVEEIAISIAAQLVKVRNSWKTEDGSRKLESVI